LEVEREAVALKYAGLEVEAGKREKERSRQFETELAKSIDEFDRQSKAFVQGLEDKALKNKLEKERTARKAEMNRAVLAKMSASGTRKREDVRTAEAEAGNTLAGPGEIKIGSKVVTSFGNIGTVERMDKEVAEVLVGGMRLREKIVNLRAAVVEKADPEGRAEKLRKQAKDANLRLDTEDADAELNLIGKTTADAEYEIDRFLDEAYLASLPRVRIIHGFGTGALKNFVHHFLKGHPHIARFAFAPPDQGGNGATIAELKQ
jgi:DNA mismatch repair protein MutS2